MPFTPFGTQYLNSVTPWPDMGDRNRAWYDPYLKMAFVKESLWYNIVRYIVNMLPVHSKTIHLTEEIPLQPEIEEQDMRGITLPHAYYDTREQEITVTSYGSVISAHKYDAMIWQWAEKAQRRPDLYANEGIPQTDLLGFIQRRLGPQMTQSLDILARNAFLANSKYRSFASTATGFYNLGASHTFNPEIARAVQLGASYTDDVRAQFPAVVSPSATYAVKSLSAGNSYIDFNVAVQNPNLLNYVIGEFENIAWMQNWRMVLWNVGEVLAQASIMGAIQVGDGAPDPTTTKVDDVYATGGADATHYIQLSAISDPGSAETGFKAGDRVTLHRERASANGAMATLNGVVWNSPYNIDAVVHSVDYSSNRITLTMPILKDNYTTALTGSIYGWVTKARPVHAAVFFKKGLAEPGVVCGVMQPPQFHIMPPIDARKAVWAFSWDAYLKYQMIDPDAYEVHFYAGAIRRGGSVLNL